MFEMKVSKMASLRREDGGCVSNNRLPLETSLAGVSHSLNPFCFVFVFPVWTAKANHAVANGDGGKATHLRLIALFVGYPPPNCLHL